MSASPDPSAVPEPRVSARRRFAGLSAAWIVPLLALAVAGAMAWRHYASLGPEIAIRLPSGAGIEAGRTPIRFRDIEIGVIEALGFEADLSGVVATAQMRESVASRLTEGTTFWVVSPQIGPSGISGLTTLLSGAYVQAELGPPDAPIEDEFVALPEPPLTPPGAPGRRVLLTAEQGSSLVPGAPVFYKSFEVGRVESKSLEDGERLIFETFIRAPWDARLSENTRFWDRSGVSVTVGAEGFEVDVASLAALLQGGVAFDTFGAAVGEARDRYALYAGERAARDSLFAEDPSEQIRLTAAFAGSVRGLEIGAPVEYRGVRIGEVEDVLIRADPASLDRLRIVATLVLQPGRLGLEGGTQSYLDYLQRSVTNGLRARLASGNIVTGSLYIELVDTARPGAASLDVSAEPYPRIPTIPSTLDEIRTTAEDLLARLGELPLEELIGRAVAILANVQALTGDEALQAAPAQLGEVVSEAAALVADLRAVTASDAIQSVPERLAETLESASAALDALEALTTDETFVTLPEELVATLNEAQAVLDNVEALTAGPAVQAAPAELVATLEAAQELLAGLRALIEAEAVQALPAELAAALEDVQAVLQPLAEADLAGSLADAVGSAEAAAGSLEAAAGQLPTLAQRLNAVAAQAEQTLAAYGPSSQLSSEAVGALREVRAAARSVSSLAQSLERRPNSLILGR